MRAFLLVVLLGLMAGGAMAQDWGKVATVSTTMGVGANRLCIGEASRGDIGCPAYAPSLTTAGDLTVSGTVTANKFIGNGAGLTNVAPPPSRPKPSASTTSPTPPPPPAARSI